MLWGAVEAEERRAPIGQWETERDEYQSKVLLGEGEELARARERGRGFSLQAAVEEALGPAAGSDPLRAGHDRGGEE